MADLEIGEGAGAGHSGLPMVQSTTTLDVLPQQSCAACNVRLGGYSRLCLSMPEGRLNKVYVHAEGKTVLLKDIPSNATVDGVCALWAARVGVSEAAHVIKASTSKGRPLEGWQPVSKALGSSLEICLSVVLQSSSKASSDSSEINGIDPSDGRGTRLLESIHEGDLGSFGTGQAHGEYQPEPISSPLIQPLLKRAAEKEASLHYKSAAFIYEQVCNMNSCCESQACRMLI